MKKELKLYWSPEGGTKTPDQKPDWTCPKCGKINAYSHSFCRGKECSEPKPR